MKKLIYMLIGCLIPFISFSQLSDQSVTTSGDILISDKSYSDYSPIVIETNGIITLDPLNGSKQVIIPNGSYELGILAKSSISNIGEITVFIYNGGNSMTFDTNTIDSYSITNLVISTNSATVLKLSSPFNTDKWFVYQPTIYETEILTGSPPEIPPPPPTTLTNGLLAYWPLNETSGSTAIDYSGNNYDGTSDGITLSASGKSTMLNRSYFFGGEDGGSSAINLPNIIGTGNSAFTFHAWIYVTTPIYGIHNNTIFIVGSPSSGGYSLASDKWTGSHNLYVGRAGVAEILTGFSSYSRNAWHSLVWIYNGTHMRVYLDGVSDSNLMGVGGSNGSPDTADRIGRASSSEAFEGYMCEVSLWNRVLTEEEITELYNGGDGVSLLQYLGE